MKTKCFLLPILLLTALNVDSARFFALNHDKDKRIYNNQLLELNSESGAVISQSKLTTSNKVPAEKLHIPLNDYMFFYASIDKKSGKIDVVNKSDLNDVKTISLDALNRVVYVNNQIKEFIYLTNDNKHLILHTGTKKNQKLTIIDVFNGRIHKQIPISRFKNNIEVSSDDNYLLVNNTSRDELTIIDLKDFNVILTSNLGKARAYATIHDNHLYLTKFSGKDRSKKFWIQSIDLISKKKVDLDIESLSEPIFDVGPKSKKLLTLTTEERGKAAVLHRLNGVDIESLATLPIKIKPEKMFVNDDFQQVLIKGKGQIATIQLANLPSHTVTKLPFDSIMYGYNDKGTLLYLKEGSGSEVAVIDVKSGELIDRSGTGRPGVKFGQFMASVALTGVGLSYGYGVYFIKYSNTGFTLNHNQDKLYVINSKTNDVTHFNADDLSERKAIATGNSTFLIHHGNQADAPLWVFSGKRINQINDETFTLEKEIEYENIIGFDMDEDYFIIKTEQDIQTYDMKTGSITSQWPLTSLKEVWTEE